MLYLAEQASVRKSGQATSLEYPTVIETKICNLVQIKSFIDIIVKIVLSNTKFIVWILEIVGKLVDIAVDAHHLCKMKGAPNTIFGTKLSNWLLLLYPARLSEWSFD